jgi:cephalosporin hydroxylase
VLSVREPAAGRADHPRITQVGGDPGDEITRRRAFEAVGESAEANAMLILGAAPVTETVRRFKRYSPLVGIGSYAIFEGTILNGRPIQPEYGPGPAEAVSKILRTRRDFAVDHRPQRFGLTFNSGGFLRRVE